MLCAYTYKIHLLVCTRILRLAPLSTFDVDVIRNLTMLAYDVDQLVLLCGK